MWSAFYKHYLLPYALITITGSLLLFHGLLLDPINQVWQEDVAQTVQRWLLALFYLGFTWLLARYLRYGLLRNLPSLMLNIIQVLVFATGLVFIMDNVFEQDISTLLATGGVGMLVVGMALKDLISSVFSGLVVSLERSFVIGDTIEVEVLKTKITGEVKEVNWRSTRLETADERLLVIPNYVLAGSTVINYSRPHKRLRKIMEIQLDYEMSSKSAQRILLAAALETKGILDTPKPYVLISSLADNGITYQIRYWIESSAEAPDTKDRLSKSILRHLHHTGIRLSYPKSEVILTRNVLGVADRTLDRFQLLKQVHSLDLLSEQQMKHIAENMREYLFNAGDEIIHMGDTEPCLWLVGEGRAKGIIERFDGEAPETRSFVATEYFGAEALFTGTSHTMAVYAETDTLIYALCKDLCAPLLAADTHLLSRIADKLAQQEMPDAAPAEQAQRAQRLQAQISAFYRQL